MVPRMIIFACCSFYIFFFYGSSWSTQ